jgi:hypothetical protein
MDKLYPPALSIKVALIQIFDIYQNCNIGAFLIIFLQLPQCQAMCILLQTNFNSSVPRLDADGILHVFTRSRDRSLHLFKVNLFSFSFPIIVYTHCNI